MRKKDEGGSTWSEREDTKKETNKEGRESQRKLYKWLWKRIYLVNANVEKSEYRIRHTRFKLSSRLFALPHALFAQPPCNTHTCTIHFSFARPFQASICLYLPPFPSSLFYPAGAVVLLGRFVAVLVFAEERIRLPRRVERPALEQHWARVQGNDT